MKDLVGTAAGKIWNYLNEHGAASVTKVTDETGISRTDAQKAIGWLLKEDKLTVENNGRTETISLK